MSKTTIPAGGITDSAVTTAKINADAVTAAKIADDAIPTDKTFRDAWEYESGANEKTSEDL